MGTTTRKSLCVIRQCLKIHMSTHRDDNFKNSCVNRERAKTHIPTHADYNLEKSSMTRHDTKLFITGRWGLQGELFLKIDMNKRSYQLLENIYLLMIRHDITNAHTDSWGLHLKFSLKTRNKLYFYRVL